MLIITLLLTMAGITFQSPVLMLLGVLIALEWRYNVCMEHRGHAGF